ncbi:MAG: FeoA domain-containing protein [Lentisphaeria bacterium]|nr:FeoA domain-containing protein [Lentisphaeria bacterium]
MADDRMVLPLDRAPRGVDLEVVSIAGGCQCSRRLTDMGVAPGTILRVEHSGGWGPMMVHVQGSKIGVGRGLCRKIKVRV